MRRRRYLAGLGVLAGLAGCTALTGSGGGTGDGDDGGDGDGGDGTGGTTSGGTPTDTAAGTPATSGDLDLPIAREELTRGAPKDAIPAITEPKFAADWSDLEIEASTRFGDTKTTKPRLSPDDQVIGVARGGEARAYPLRVLNWHEVANDTLDGPLLVTYCPLCGSAITAVRTVNGEETTFGVSGFLFRNDLVMYDELTGSLWSQIVATAINGPETGSTLELLPSTLTTWGEWQEEHDNATVLLPPPVSSTVVGPDATRDYTINPYAGYDQSRRIGIGGSFDDDRLHPKATVIGVANGGAARAYPLEAVEKERLVNDEVGGLPVVVAVAPGETLVAYERTVDGETIEFAPDGEEHMTGGGSRWKISTGTAVDGSFEGTTLTQANDASPMFFFAWKDFNEDTEVYGADSS